MRRCSLLPALALLPLAARAQGFAERPISLVTGYSPGGSTDIAARMLSDRFAAHLGAGTRVVVENRPGAAGAVTSEWLRRQPADASPCCWPRPVLMPSHPTPSPIGTATTR